MVLGDLLDPAQASLVNGRSIIDDVNLTQELIRKYTRKRSSPRCMLEVDLKKDFGMVDWGFLIKAPVGFGFPQQYYGLIKECVTTTSYSIYLNGGIHGFFSGRGGLQQGDPLSPLLFGLCIEVLSRSLNETSKKPSFHFHTMCKSLGITHQAYADDLMMFARADETSIKVLEGCLKHF